MYILPQPQSILWKDGEFRLRYDTGIVIDVEIPGEESAYVYDYAKMLQEEIAAATGFTLPIRRERARFGGNRVCKLVACGTV